MGVAEFTERAAARDDLPRRDTPGDTDHEVAKGQVRVHAQADSVPPATFAMLTRLLGTFRGSFFLSVEGTYTTASSITSVSVTSIVAAKLQPA